MTKEEKLNYYYEAKKAYYEGNPIMGDVEFDELELSLGLENNSIIGAGSTPNYTIKHPFIMGSLSKIQIKKSEGSNINWFFYGNQVLNYLHKSNCEDLLVPCIITPKFDGCSFEYHYTNGNVVISSRGDGNYGRDLTNHLQEKCKKLYKCLNYDEYVIRGEVLISKTLFKEKYSDFTNPRSFVSGILNRKYNDIEDKSVLDDLSIIVYDCRVVGGGKWVDIDWPVLLDTVPPYLLPEKYSITVFDGANSIKVIYDEFDAYRETYDFALDGIVIKPTFGYRRLNMDKERPEDCVAIKFLPTIIETTVIDVEWQLGKTGEYTPVIWFEEIILDGKKVNKASGHNYGFINDNRVCAGTKIKVSLAGDIIPFIYDVTPNATYTPMIIVDSDMYVDGCHLMKKLSLVEKMEVDFLASCKSLNITGIGDKQAQQIFDSLEYKVEHIFFVTDEQINKALNRGNGKTAQNAIAAISECKKNKNLADIIVSMNIKDCGIKTAEQCARYLINQNLADFSGLSSDGWNWVIDASLPFDVENDAHKLYNKLLSLLRHKDGTIEGKELDKYVDDYKVNEGQIKIIMTGSPSQYKSKNEFLSQHPEYIETGKWKECQILFTGDINSTSSKMEKAKKLGIEIIEY